MQIIQNTIDVCVYDVSSNPSEFLIQTPMRYIVDKERKTVVAYAIDNHLFKEVYVADLHGFNESLKHVLSIIDTNALALAFDSELVFDLYHSIQDTCCAIKTNIPHTLSDKFDDVEKEIRAFKVDEEDEDDFCEQLFKKHCCKAMNKHLQLIGASSLIQIRKKPNPKAYFVAQNCKEYILPRL